jgi:hypothetical protein
MAKWEWLLVVQGMQFTLDEHPIRTKLPPVVEPEVRRLFTSFCANADSAVETP